MKIELESALSHLNTINAVDVKTFEEWAALNPGGVCKLIRALKDRLPNDLAPYVTIQDSLKVAARQSRSRKAKAKEGSKQIAVMLSPQAVAKLTKWQAKGESIAGTVNRLLEKSRP